MKPALKPDADLMAGIQRVISGPLTERALVALICEAMPPAYRNKPQITEVLRAAANVSDLYFKKAKHKGAEHVER
jgi:hypothetical protein